MHGKIGQVYCVQDFVLLVGLTESTGSDHGLDRLRNCKFSRGSFLFLELYLRFGSDTMIVYDNPSWDCRSYFLCRTSLASFPSSRCSIYPHNYLAQLHPLGARGYIISGYIVI